MQLRDILTSVGQRWYFVLIGLVITAGLGYAAVRAAPPQYEAQGYVVLMPGPSTYPLDSNPFLYLGGGSATRDLLVRVMSTQDVREPILQTHPDSDVVAAPDPTGGPLLHVVATAPAPEQAVSTMGAMLEQVPEALDALQDERDVPSTARFTASTLVEDQEATINRSATMRAVVVATVAGLVLTVLGTVWLDALLRTRREPSGKHSPAPKAKGSVDDSDARPDETGEAGFEWPIGTTDRSHDGEERADSSVEDLRRRDSRSDPSRT